jgi:hypothetical protein
LARRISLLLFLCKLALISVLFWVASRLNRPTTNMPRDVVTSGIARFAAIQICHDPESTHFNYIYRSLYQASTHCILKQTMRQLAFNVTSSAHVPHSTLKRLNVNAFCLGPTFYRLQDALLQIKDGCRYWRKAHYKLHESNACQIWNAGAMQLVSHVPSTFQETFRRYSYRPL